MIKSFVFNQSQGRLISQDLSLDLLKVVLQDDGVQFWVDIGECADEEAKTVLEGVFQFHPLAIEDCFTPSDRAKVEEYDGYLFLVVHAVTYVNGELKSNELDMFIGKNFLVTYHHAPLKCVNATMERVLKNAPAVARAPDRLTYTILDFLLEGYAPALEEISVEISNLEKSIMVNQSKDTLADVMKLKGEVQRLRQVAWPQRETIARLAHGEFKIVRSHMVPYYRDLLDQLVRISSLAENARDSLTGVLQVHLNLQQMQVNHVIKVLTVMATLCMPALVLTSYYGMNINHWPSLDDPHGWVWVWLITALTTGVLYFYLKRRGWW
ncbi:MAG: magnesium/cobalt transporter CorA [bacterium]|jgi:magnesium transporter